jgi:hypothetical protein
MKKLLAFITILSFIFITRVNAGVLTFDKGFEIPANTNIVEFNNNYIAVDNNVLTKYDYDFNSLQTKEFEDITESDIIVYNNQILLVANNNNFIKLFLLDSDLKVLKSKETTIYYKKPNLYEYDSKIYLVLGDNYVLEDTNMYEIDLELNVKENSISSYGDKLKDILKSDYYAFNNEDITEEITATTYNKDYNVIAGEGFLRLLNKKGELVKEIEFNDTINDLVILNNKIIALINENVLEISFDLEIENENNLFEVNPSSLIISGDRVIVRINNYFGILVYNFNININRVESNLGTLEVLNTAKPGTKVTFKATANSGYEIEKIIVTDEYGNEVKVLGDYFIAPSSDVTIEVKYIESVVNPETLDIIYIVAIISFITLLIYIKVSRKLNWINK